MGSRGVFARSCPHATSIKSMHTPEAVTDKRQLERLEQAVARCLTRLNESGKFEAERLMHTVVRMAARFFAYCPEDFGINSFEGGHAVFGGTNRLLWSVFNGFWPDPPYCSRRFLAQFEEEWVTIGALDTRWVPPRIVLTASDDEIAVPLGWGGNRHTIFGKRDKHQRITEVRFLTGMSEIPYVAQCSKQTQSQRPEDSVSGI
jgi:hypothetical protein